MITSRTAVQLPTLTCMDWPSNLTDNCSHYANKINSCFIYLKDERYCLYLVCTCILIKLFKKLTNIPGIVVGKKCLSYILTLILIVLTTCNKFPPQLKLQESTLSKYHDKFTQFFKTNKSLLTRSICLQAPKPSFKAANTNRLARQDPKNNIQRDHFAKKAVRQPLCCWQVLAHGIAHST